MLGSVRRSSSFPPRVLAAILLILVAGSGASLDAQQSLAISGNSLISAGQSASFDLELTNTQPVEGFVIAIEYDPVQVSIQGISVIGTVTAASGAELVVPEILSSGFTLGVVLDASAPFDAQTIAVGTDQVIGTFVARAESGPLPGDPDLVTGFSFLDGALNNPPLSNIIVQGGNSIGAGEGLGLLSAPNALTIGPAPPIELLIENATFADGGGCAQVQM